MGRDQVPGPGPGTETLNPGAQAADPGPDLFLGMLTRLVTGCSWVTAEKLLGGRVSDTTMRPAATNGSPRGCSRTSKTKPSRPMTASWGWT